MSASQPMSDKHVCIIVATVFLSIILLVGLLLSCIQTAHAHDDQVRRDHIAACRTIDNEQVRRDCLVGPQWVSSLVYPH